MSRHRTTAVLAGTWAFAFIAFFGTYATTFDSTLRVFTVFAYAVPVSVAALVLTVLRPHPLDVPIIVLLGAYALVSVASTDPTASLETLVLASAYASTFLVLLRLDIGPLSRGLVGGATLAGTAWLAFSAVRWIGEALTWVQLDGTMPPLTARSGNLWLSTDAVAALALLIAPYYLRIEWQALRNVLLGVGLVSAVIVIPLSGGRAEWAGMLAAAGVYWVGSRAGERTVRPHARIVAAASTAAVALIAAGGAWLAGMGHFGTVSGRTYVWESAVAVIAQRPLTGAGPGTFSWVRLADSPDSLFRLPVYHAHNIGLQLLADGGVVLFAAFVGFCAVYLLHMLRARRPRTPADWLAIASLVGFAVILMLDELTQLPGLAALAIGNAAFAARQQTATRRPLRGGGARRLAPAVGLLVLAVGAVPAAAAAHAARSSAAVGQDDALAGDWRAAQQAFAAAAAAWPTHASYQLALGMTYAHLGAGELARRHYARAAALSPGDPRAFGGLAATTGDPRVRVDALTRASRLGVRDAQYAYRLALELVAQDEPTAATAALARAALVDHQLLVMPDQDALGFSVRDLVDAVDAAMDSASPSWGVDVAAIDGAVDVVLGRPPADPVMRAIALARTGELAAARATTDAELRAQPHDRAARLTARALSQAACDADEVARHDRLLALLPGGSGSLYRTSGALRRSPDHMYREIGLGDYQPPDVARLPVRPSEWPAGYLPQTSCSP